MNPRYRADDLVTFATTLLNRSGLDNDMSRATAEVLVEGDLLGHTTHGLALLAPYLTELDKGAMTKSGEPRVLADFPSAITWDGMLLPGAWLVRRAIDLASQRVKVNGSCTVVIRRSHHIACLEAYLKPVTDGRLVVLLMCSDPACKGVAPHGARTDVYTPNPIAAAWPTDGEPVMIDISMSITSLGSARRLMNEGRRFPANWAIDASGNPTDDPSVAYVEPKGALLPIGGVDHGHKGFAMGLLVEMLTSGLAGFGRADDMTGWSANVFLQILDPRLFGGLDELTRQTSWLADACRSAPPREGFDCVRLPGESALKRRADQLANGVELYPTILASLDPWTQKLDVALYKHV
jgi:LDH2 family malate/lactate/ureidoglycolate dehydrogenase